MVFGYKISQYFGLVRQNRYRARGLAQVERMRKARRLLVEPLEERRLLTTINLAALGSGGTTIFGADASDRSGISVSSAGDINGDGFDDFVIGASWGGSSGNPSNRFGESYVIFGAASLPATIDLASLGSAGITIFGADADDQSGLAVSSAGDVNGDGFDDVIIAALRGDASGNVKEDAGESYVIFGAASLPATINLATLGSAGITIFGIDAGDLSGDSVSSAGDVNGDGFDDLIIGASLSDASGNAKNRAGESYVIFGAASLPATIDLTSLGSAGVTIFGADESDYSGQSVSSAGDINGDGFDDLLIGAYLGDASGNAKVDAGDSYVIFGAASLPATIDLSSLGSAGIFIFGGETNDKSGFSVSSVGDMNGDGFDDLVIGAPSADGPDADGPGNARNLAGDSYVIFGAASLPPTIDLASLGSAGITIFGAEDYDNSGHYVSSAGDINGDGFDDLIIGAPIGDGPSNNRAAAGDSYLIFGAASLPATIDLAALGSAGVTIWGTDNYDRSGRSISSAGDINGDGFDDFIIGALGGDALGNAKEDAGESYVIFGRNEFTNSILSANLGNSSANTINGTSGAQILNGADGNDTLIGNGGADILIGGRGDDILAVSDLTFRRVVGGNGTDTLRLNGSGLLLNLTTIPDNRIVDIEIIDIRGSGDNTLTLNYREVLNISSHSNTLIVRRNAGDLVNIGSGWTQLADEVIDNTTFQVLIQGNARLKLQQVPITVIDLAALGSEGTTVFGADAFDRSGLSVSSAGDINGDGFDDFIIGAPQGDALGNAKSNAGESYVIYGAAVLPATIDLTTLGSAGITIFGVDPSDQSGFSVSSAGDVNGDGFDDLVIGAYLGDAVGNAKSNAGESYVIFGGASLPSMIDLATLGLAGITIFGADSVDDSGFSVSSAGDVNGDGFDDLAIGARGADASGNAKGNAGESYLIFGAASLPATIDLANLGSLAGTIILGADTGDQSGTSVSSAGDINGDGFDDLITWGKGSLCVGQCKESCR